VTSKKGKPSSKGMPARSAYVLIYDPEIVQHLKAVDHKYYSLIQRTIEQRLRYEPATETRNRKPLRRPSTFGIAWELRFGPDNRFRVFYRTEQSTREVHILAIGVKIGSRLFIGEEEFTL
jgi:mRNA-degrading endonuclease RelE of RelBE toxin-antitoxin system